MVINMLICLLRLIAQAPAAVCSCSYTTPLLQTDLTGANEYILFIAGTALVLCV